MSLNLTIPPETMGGWITIGLLGYAALCILIGLFLGFKRGFMKTLIRIITIAAAAVLAYYVAISISSSIDGMFAGKSLEEIITSVYPSYETAVDPKTREIIAAFDAETAQLILNLGIAIVVAPIAYVILFLVAKLALIVVYWILGAIFSSRRKSGLSRLLGGVLGILQGALVAVCVIAPITGLLTLAGDVKADLTSSEDATPENIATIESFYETWLDDPISNPILNIVADTVGNKMYEGLTKATVGGSDYDMRDEASLIAGVYVDVIELKGMNWQAPSEEEQIRIRHIVTKMSQDEYMCRVLAGVLRGSSHALVENAEVFELGEPYSSLLKEAFGIFETSSSDNVGADINTMLDVYFLLANNDVLTLMSSEDQDALKEKLTAKNGEELLIDSVIGTLNENPRTAELVTLFTKLSISIMADQLGLSEDVQEIYDNVKDEVNNILALDKNDYETEEEYRTAVNDNLTSALENNGIVLEDEIVTGMSDYIVDNFSEIEEITDEQINDIILSYYSSYAEYIEKGELPPELPF